MRIAIVIVMGLSLLGTSAVTADAGSPAHKQRHKPRHTYKSLPAPSAGDYYERLADKLPFGSGIWWEQMLRERRGGRPG